MEEIKHEPKYIEMDAHLEVSLEELIQQAIRTLLQEQENLKKATSERS